MSTFTLGMTLFSYPVSALDFIRQDPSARLSQVQPPPAVTFKLERLMDPSNPKLEQVSLYEGSTLWNVSRAVGLLDIRASIEESEVGSFSCTGFVIDAKHVMTNAHCVAGKLPSSDDVRTSDKRFRATDIDFVPNFFARNQTQPFEVIKLATRAVVIDEKLDFAVLAVVEGDLSQYGRLYPSMREPQARESLVAIHHAGAREKVVTRYGCRISSELSQHGPENFYHFCDTMKSSSGAPLLVEGTREVLGLHFAAAEGGATANVGKSIFALRQASPLLREIWKEATAEVNAEGYASLPLQYRAVYDIPSRVPLGLPKGLSLGLPIEEAHTLMTEELTNDIRLEGIDRDRSKRIRIKKLTISEVDKQSTTEDYELLSWTGISSRVSALGYYLVSQPWTLTRERWVVRLLHDGKILRAIEAEQLIDLGFGSMSSPSARMENLEDRIESRAQHQIRAAQTDERALRIIGVRRGQPGHLSKANYSFEGDAINLQNERRLQQDRKNLVPALRQAVRTYESEVKNSPNRDGPKHSLRRARDDLGLLEAEVKVGAHDAYVRGKWEERFWRQVGKVIVSYHVLQDAHLGTISSKDWRKYRCFSHQLKSGLWGESWNLELSEVERLLAKPVFALGAPFAVRRFDAEHRQLCNLAYDAINYPFKSSRTYRAALLP